MTEIRKNPRVAISMRTGATEYNEPLDSLSQAWVHLLESMDLMPILLPASLSYPEQFLHSMNISGVILTGGDDLASQKEEPNELEKNRDEKEIRVIKFCQKNSLPLLGVCRGLQLLISHTTGKIPESIHNHAGTKHNLVLTDQGKLF